MRKKSHISLARDIVHHSDDDLLKKHPYTMYAFLHQKAMGKTVIFTTVIEKHEFDGTFGLVRKKISSLSQEQGENGRRRTKYFRNLGQITHYIADYFTFPHNKIYTGNLRDHCSYEEELKLRLREYLGTESEKREHIKKLEFLDAEAICDFIERSHEEYLKRKINVDEDIRHIVSLNHQVVEGIKQLTEKGRAHHLFRQGDG